MRPDFSVLLLTTLIGAGQGLFLALATVDLYALFELLPRQDARLFHAYGALLVLALLAAGLGASFFHLGRPERAWRTAARWRTSWLSREVIVLPALMGVVFLYGTVHLLQWTPAIARLPSGVVVDATVVLAAAGTALAFALYVCTAMIYASLPFLREWASPLTVINYILQGGASGFTLAAAFSLLAAPELSRFFAAWALIITLLAAAARIASLVRNRRLRPKSTLQTALGIRHPQIAQKSQGFMGGSFNTREFFHGSPASRLPQVRTLFLVGAFALPALLLAACLSGAGSALLLPAFLLQYAGLLAERWYFFAEARHPQNLYYQSMA
jgi:DMSO reductase anchor subunit